ncbi:MAG: phasin family protein [Massilia sp.]
MTSLPEQLSAKRESQFEAQRDFFRVLTQQALQSAEQVIALNVSTWRASVERSSNAVRQLFSISDPRDLLSFTSRTQVEIQNLISYNRELFSIAAGARLNQPRQAAAAPALPPPARPQAAPALPPPARAQAAPLPAPARAPEAAAPAPAEKPDDYIAEQVARAKRKPVVATEPEPEPEPEPVATAKPLAKALGKIAPKPATAEHPLASPVAGAQGKVELPPIKPVEAAPPPAPVAGTPAIDVKQADAPRSKGGRRK